MRTDTAPVAMSRDEKILALSLMIEDLKAEKRIEDWLRANPSATCWTMQEGIDRVCTIVRDARTIAHCKGATDDDARAQAFSVIFTNEAAATI